MFKQYKFYVIIGAFDRSNCLKTRSATYTSYLKTYTNVTLFTVLFSADMFGSREKCVET